MPSGAENAIRTCLRIKPSEKVLLLTDSKMLATARVLFDEVLKINPSATIIEMTPTSRDGEEPPKKIAKLMKSFDVILMITFHSLSHTKARKAACEAGARIASMPGLDRFSLTKGGLTADYTEVNGLCKMMKKALVGSNILHVYSENGTDITFSVSGRRWSDDEGQIRKRKHWGNLPAGEVATAPVEGTANGFIFFDHMGDFGKKVKILVKNGIAVSIFNSVKMQSAIKHLGKKARVLAEIGIGTNPKAKVIGNVLEDEKVYGTVHMAFGNNLEGGGKNNIQLHKDGIIKKPTLQVDGRTIIDNGRWKI
jgi:aminopeptidase